MKIEDIKVCPSCGSEDLDKSYKTFIKCKKCESKIGITNGKVWYEYILKSD